MNETAETVVNQDVVVSRKLRLANYVIDLIAMLVMFFVSTLAMMFLGYEDLVD